MLAGLLGMMAVNSLQAADPELLAKGRHLVEEVGMCADCHSPRKEKGEYDRNRWLQGAPLGFAATVPVADWSSFAPPIAGLASYTDEQAVTFLTSGATNRGAAARPPMPAYRFSPDEAQAIVVYLRSLPAP